MKLYELKLTDIGVYAISLVEEPAIEEDFIALSKQEDTEVLFKATNEEQREVTGLILVPNKRIYRASKDGGYEVYIKPETIKEASRQYLLQANQHNATLEHEHEVDGVYLSESWIVEDPKLDKTAALGLNAVKGAWAGTMKIDNDDVWQNFVKTGKVKGFSIEALFNHVEGGNIEQQLSELLAALNSEFNTDK